MVADTYCETGHLKATKQLSLSVIGEPDRPSTWTSVLPFDAEARTTLGDWPRYGEESASDDSLGTLAYLCVSNSVVSCLGGLGSFM